MAFCSRKNTRLGRALALSLIHISEHLLVVNKPKGMVVHPAPGNPDGTMVNALLWHLSLIHI